MKPGMPAVSGVVLAGGRSARFGRDKLVEPIGDLPLFQHAVDALGALTTDVIVVAAPDVELPIEDPVRLVHDAAPYEGPLAGCLTGLLMARLPVGADRRRGVVAALAMSSAPGESLDTAARSGS